MGIQYSIYEPLLRRNASHSISKFSRLQTGRREDRQRRVIGTQVVGDLLAFSVLQSCKRESNAMANCKFEETIEILHSHISAVFFFSFMAYKGAYRGSIVMQSGRHLFRHHSPASPTTRNSNRVPHPDIVAGDILLVGDPRRKPVVVVFVVLFFVPLHYSYVLAQYIPLFLSLSFFVSYSPFIQTI